jgi:hypothetical protein
MQGMHLAIAAMSQAISGNVGNLKDFTREMPQCLREYLGNCDNAWNAPGNCGNCCNVTDNIWQCWETEGIHQGNAPMSEGISGKF